MSERERSLNDALGSRIGGYMRHRRNRIRAVTWAQTDRCLWCYTDFGSLRKRLKHQKETKHPQFFKPGVGACECGEHHKNFRDACKLARDAKKAVEGKP